MCALQRLLLAQSLLTIIAKCSLQPLYLDAAVQAYWQNNSMILQYQILQTVQSNLLFCFAETKAYAQQQKKVSSTLSYFNCSLFDTTNQFYCIELYRNSSTGTNFAYSQGYQKLVLWENVFTSDMSTKRAGKGNDDGIFSYFVSGARKGVRMEDGEVGNGNGSGNESGDGLGDFLGGEEELLAANSSLQQNQLYNISIENNVQSVRMGISGFMKEDGIYHMYTCPNYDSANKNCLQFWKENYLVAIKHPQQRQMGNLVQRKNYCGMMKRNGNNFTNLIFYGGTVRNNQQVMFFAVWTKLTLDPTATTNTQILNMWAGISYSRDHANRDMFCYSSDGTHFDAISLVAGPVYKDTASNIGGQQNVQIVDVSYSDQFKAQTSYFLQFNRNYSVEDGLGDERIFRKIYDQFSFAAYFGQAYSDQVYTMKVPSCLSSQYKHNFLMKFLADVSLYQIIGGYFQGVMLIMLIFLNS